MTSKTRRRDLRAAAAWGGISAVLVGASGPWVQGPVFATSGLGTGVGLVTIAAALLGYAAYHASGLSGWAGRGVWLAAAGGLILLLGLREGNTHPTLFESAAGDTLGWGLYATLLGGFVLAGVGVLALLRPRGPVSQPESQG